MDKKNVIKKRTTTADTKDNVIVPITPKPKKDDHIVIDGKKYLHEADEEFESCCFKCDKPLCLYIGKYTISLLVLVFCFMMLQDKSNSAEFYTGTIAGLLGHYLNTPIAQLSGKKDKDKKD